jgi:hypothetical protein
MTDRQKPTSKSAHANDGVEPAGVIRVPPAPQRIIVPTSSSGISKKQNLTAKESK